jgi:glycosyltransferase involved in cell wall biosynthesis
MAQPKISVVIATHNHAHFLPECLNSVKGQTYPDYEVIVVNNGSTDNTREVVDKLSWEKLKYHYQADTGSVAGPRNSGIRLARGEYVSFLDSDDLWYPNKLEKVIGIFRSHPDLAAISHDLLRRVYGQVEQIIKVGPKSADKDFFEQLLFYGNFIAGSATTVRREVLLKNAGFDEGKKFVHSEDYELWLRLAYQGKKFYFINECLGEYRVHGSNLGHDFAACFGNEINVILKHFKNYKKGNVLYRYFLCGIPLGRIYFNLSYRYFLGERYLKCIKYILMSFFCFPFYFQRNKSIVGMLWKMLCKTFRDLRLRK